MPRVTWALKALADIERLDQFLRRRNPDAATRAVLAIRDGVRQLQAFPETGRPAARLGMIARELPILFGNSGYLVFYRYDGGDIHVLAVRHFREADYTDD